MNNNGSKPNNPKPSGQKPPEEKISKEAQPSNETSDFSKDRRNVRQDDQPSQQEKYKKTYDEFEHKVKDTFKNIQESSLYHRALGNKEQTLSYILLGLGLLLFFVDYLFVGGLLIGAVLGYHFSTSIAHYLRTIPRIIEGPDQLRYILITGLLIVLLFTVPGILIGALFAAIFKQFVYPNKETSVNEPRNDSKSNRPKN
jgi:hypothetical protein